MVKMKYTIIGVITLTLLNATSARAEQLPAFKVAAQETTAVVLLVAPSTTDSGLTDLLNALRDARRSGTLQKLIPPTTPRGTKGRYAVVMLFVMSDPTYATRARLTAFVNPKASGVSATEK